MVVDAALDDDGAVASLRVTVCYARPHQAWRRELTVPVGTTAAQAIAASGFRAAFADTDPLAHGLAVYGQPCAPDQRLRDGDRVDILRPLVFDPKESRRRRAALRKLTPPAPSAAAPAR